MKLKDEFMTHQSGDKQHMIDTSGKFSGLITSNTSAAFIVDRLHNETTVEEIVSAMAEEYDAPKEVLEKDVRKIVESLRNIGAIDE